MNKIDLCLQIATKAHAGQLGKNGEPYVLHPLSVGLMGATDNERMAGRAARRTAMCGRRSFSQEKKCAVTKTRWSTFLCCSVCRFFAVFALIFLLGR